MIGSGNATRIKCTRLGICPPKIPGNLRTVTAVAYMVTRDASEGAVANPSRPDENATTNKLLWA